MKTKSVKLLENIVKNDDKAENQQEKSQITLLLA